MFLRQYGLHEPTWRNVLPEGISRNPSRSSEDGQRRTPLLLNKTPEEVDKFIHEQLKLREPYYEKAKHIIDINVMDNYDKINAIVQQIRDLLNI